jgi:GntR family transcriptional regulator
MMDRSPRSDRLYRQAEQRLLELIERGTYAPGEQIPSEVDLAAQFGISRPTLREALLHLEQAGAIVRKHGVGTFVASAYGLRLESGLERLESVFQMTARQGMEAHIEGLACDQEPAEPAVAERLAIPPGTPLTTVRRTIVVDGRPAAYMLDLAPPDILSPQDIGESFSGSVLDVLRQRPDLHVSQAVADIVPVDADALLAERLSIRPGQAILLLEEVLLAEGGIPIEFSRNYFVPSMFRFHVLRR